MERGKSGLFLHKDEWNRLKSVVHPAQEPTTNEYVQSLIEKSQQWINSWPDSVQGHIIKLERQKEKQHAKDMAMFKLFTKQQKEISKKKKCIEKAKQMIFDDSCYGRRLISALLESKTLEERDAQLEFKKKIKESAPAKDILHNTISCSLENAVNMKNQERESRKRENDKEVAQVNKSIYLTQYENNKRDKERQKQMEIEDLRVLAKFNELKHVQKVNERILIKKDVEKFEAEQKEIKDRKAVRENQEERILEIWRKHEDRKNTIMKRIHEKRFNESESTDNYELVKKLKEDEQNRYDEFINKAIVRHTRRLQIKKEEDSQKIMNERNKQYLLLQSNKKLQDSKPIIETDKNISTCDRQCIITKCKNISKTKQLLREQDTVTFAPSNNRLKKNLREREKEPSPWSSAPAAHAQFSHQAGQTLQECQYKQMAHKVVDDYRRQHGLNPQNLPVANYI